MNKPFINLEDEITLRLSIKKAFKHEGWLGLYQIMGELSESLIIVSDVAKELLDEEKKDKKQGA